mmetsp:Transcript_34268/g.65460  ORF Transcript_34268/g.65460 Transcript_34268/m.65460 type:complete len:214 (+) Transcript_34268:491-1132(+)
MYNYLQTDNVPISNCDMVPCAAFWDPGICSHGRRRRGGAGGRLAGDSPCLPVDQNHPYRPGACHGHLCRPRACHGHPSHCLEAFYPGGLLAGARRGVGVVLRAGFLHAWACVCREGRPWSCLQDAWEQVQIPQGACVEGDTGLAQGGDAVGRAEDLHLVPPWARRGEGAGVEGRARRSQLRAPPPARGTPHQARTARPRANRSCPKSDPNDEL